MSTSELPRPDAHDVVSADIAGPQLAAVRAMLDDLLDEVLDAEWAADTAELAAGARAPLGEPADEAIALSQQIVEQMRASRGPELAATVDTARQVAEARVVQASRLASSLSETARQEAAQVLHQALPAEEADLPHWGEPSVAPVPPITPVAPATPTASTAPPPVPAPVTWRAPEADLPHWADPKPPLPAAPEPAHVHDQFWREEQQATQARSEAVSPLEILLPTAALLLLLVAVLVLIH